ncbi:MAG: nucleotide sugar dehydrogenase [Phycisphaerae bacterium]|nr:nucleotide sugar dehydrogenase [Phycisphaerae bacterium]
MRISVFGLGYVGAVSCGCLAALGHHVIGVDVVADKVARIGRGESPIIEDGIGPILKKAVNDKRLTATTDVAMAVGGSDAALVCVGTPSAVSGGVDATFLERVCRQIGEAAKAQKREFYCVLSRSTSLPAVHTSLMRILEDASGSKLGDRIGYVCHPEFLREGVAVHDFYHPPKIVFGPTDPKSSALCRQLYPGVEAESYFVAPEIAAMVKYADNCFHALKVTFANEIGLICKSLGIDSHGVMDIFCKDRKLNISDKYLKPGNPFGGSCLAKDLRGILDASRATATPLPMLAGALDSNRVQVERLVRRIVSASGRSPVGLVGLAFKEGTDDVRESPMVYLVEQLLGKGVPVKIYDEHLAVQGLVGSNKSFALESIPHLADLLSNDLAGVVTSAMTIVVNHRLDARRWSAAGITPKHRVLDLINIPELRGYTGYDGLYW